MLFDEAVDCARLTLLSDKVLAAPAGYKLHYEKHDDKHNHRAQREQG